MLMNFDLNKVYKILINNIKNPLYANSYYLILNSIVGSALGFVFWMIAARYYSTNDVGLVVAIFSAIGLLTAISKIGLDIAIIKYLPMQQNKIEIVNLSLSLPLTISFVLAIIYLSGVTIWSPNLLILNDKIYSSIFIIFTCAYTMFTLQNNIFIAVRFAKMSFFLSTFWAILKIPLLIIFSSLGLIGVFSSWGLMTVISSVVGIIILSRIFDGYKPFIILKSDLIKSMMHYSFGNYIAGFLFSMPSLIIPLFLVNINPEMSAFFYIAWMIAGILYSMMGAINLSLFAECSHNSDKLKANLISTLKLILIILVPATAAVILFGNYILSSFGENYSNNAYKLLILLTVSSFPYAINQIFITINRVKAKVMPIIYLNGFIALCVFFIISISINEIGLISVGIAWLVTQCISALIASIYIYKTYLS